MVKPLRVLILEDAADDAELLVRALKNGGYEPEYRIVDTADALVGALDEAPWDVIISDYSMPNFTGAEALEMVKRRGQDVPFIFVSGTIGEDTAVEAMRAGAKDYLVKGNTKRLLPAIDRELREAAKRREAAQAEATMREIEDQLRQAQKMEAVGQLTGGLAHDFRNMLGVIIGNLDLLRERIGHDAEACELVDNALRASVKGSDLNNSLLAFSRKQPLNPQPLDIGQALADTVKLLTTTLGENIEIALDVAKPIGEVVVDRAQLEAAILNLAINARDAMPSGGRLAFSVRQAGLDEGYARRNKDVRPGPHIEIAVNDTGVGMSPDVAARAFEPFFTTKGRDKGTGLGLSMVYGFIKQSGGHVEIASIEGRGTTVRLFLPASQARATASDARPPVAAAIGGDEHVLVVEDNADLRRLAVRQIRDLGYQVAEAPNGPAALQILRAAGRIDLLFTDIMMPGGLDGPALAREAVKLRPGLKVLFTSGFAGDHGDDDFPILQKPYRKPELAAILRAVLDGTES